MPKVVPFIKKETKFLFFLCLLVLPAGVYAGETIPSFDAHIVVRDDAVIEVTETIVYDFGENAKDRHGIFRFIPYSYQAGTETYTAQISGVVVTDEAGQSLPFTEDKGKGTGVMSLKIGDPTQTVAGIHTYVISYIVAGPFLWFEDTDELYWNVTGEWPKGITRASVIVDLPVSAKVVDAACYQGAVGAKQACDESEKLVSAERAGYRATAKDLEPKEQFSFAVSFPKGTVTERNLHAQAVGAWPAVRYAWFGIPPIVLAVAGMWWYRRRREDNATYAEPSEEPESGGSDQVVSELAGQDATVQDAVKDGDTPLEETEQPNHPV